jgi:glycine betaine/proline transport system permease protein
MLAQASSPPFWNPQFFDEHPLPIGDWFEEAVFWLTVHAKPVFDVIRWPVDQILERSTDFLTALPWPLVMLAFLLIGWRVRGLLAGLLSAVALVSVGFLAPELWEQTMETLAMIVTAVSFCVVVGIPLGIFAARSDRVEGILRPVLDAMQTIHPFVYLLPAVFFFGYGSTPGVIVTIIFALPPIVRLTNLGIRQVPVEAVEAGRAFGSSELQLLRDVQLPLARPTIMAGLNQTLMLSLSMVVIVALIAGGGLGQVILRGVNRASVPIATTSGIAVLILAVVLDRVSQGSRAQAGARPAGRRWREWPAKVRPF